MKKFLLFSMLAAIVSLIYFVYADVKPAFNAWRPPLSGITVMIDPGHGGLDGGAGSEPVLEKDIALSVSEKLRDFLNGQGAVVMMTREEDTDLAQKETKSIRTRKTEDLNKRKQLINESKADLFISIHLNAIPAEQWRGAQTFYSPHLPENEKIASDIQKELKGNLGNTDRQPAEIGHVFILKEADITGALVEIGFLSNPSERRLLESEEYQEKTAAAISRGILRFFARE
ncbi:N-acetylmuramoyl-L-alanine amidase CwlD [Domibacillus enclensis]|uniref:N-acetylmuramoyl-L-alanine amidase n=1 Tax=Domibacillus enclensis TaxID=1017273 RepID=A0A1N7CI78_9BACI|nr:N-acetylmuramoyl-L-alanine amidase CwlD [Domibacillus enclensis]OXS73882.1 N-acetylmuramoyl-L-alanine amidase CwlD [Domibacillus enclensis]SIR63275.1 N-acetylmuramoyl-L-alanine amidase [Domibacillus enclensis]